MRCCPSGNDGAMVIAAGHHATKNQVLTEPVALWKLVAFTSIVSRKNARIAMSSTVEKVKIAENGRLVLPKAIRDAVGIDGEARLSVWVEGGEVHLAPVSRNVAKAQALYRKHVKQDFTSEDFLKTRERD
jgi:AbrB family looped-hinge helix DNA binding protein